MFFHEPNEMMTSEAEMRGKTRPDETKTRRLGRGKWCGVEGAAISIGGFSSRSCLLNVQWSTLVTVGPRGWPETRKGGK